MNLNLPNLETLLKAAGAALLVAQGVGHALTQHLGLGTSTVNENIALGLGVYLAAPIVASFFPAKPKTP